jgi:lysophospholipase L1-like esterase
LAKLGVAGGAVILFLTILNLGVEFFEAAPGRTAPIQIWGLEEDSKLGEPGGTFRSHPFWFWELQPGGRYNGEEINDDGYRGRIFPKNKTARVRIATMGDSSTFGFRVLESEAWPRRLEVNLRERGYDVEVVNFGVIGFSVYQGYTMFRGRVQDYSPDILCLAFGAINEHFPTTGSVDDFEKAKILGSLQYRTYDVLARYPIFRWLNRLAGRGSSAPANAAAPAVAPTPATTVAGATSTRPAMRVSPDEFEDLVVKIQQIQKGRGGEVLLVSPPRTRFLEKESPVVERFTRSIERAAAKIGAPVADVRAAFRAHEIEGNPGEDFQTSNDWFIDSVHPTPAGHTAYAEAVAKRLVDSQLLEKAKGR